MSLAKTYLASYNAALVAGWSYVLILAFAALRTAGRPKDYLGAFGRLSAANLRKDLDVPIGRGVLATDLVRFLAKLWADGVGELVDHANRDAHAGALRARDAPLPAQHYRRASELLLNAASHADAAPTVAKRPRRD